MKSYKQPGEVIDWVNNTGDDVSVDTLVQIKDRVGVTCVDIADGDTGSVKVWGVCEVNKLSGDAIEQGDTLYLEADAARLTLDSTDGSTANAIAGYAFADAGAGTAKVLVKLNG